MCVKCCGERAKTEVLNKLKFNDLAQETRSDPLYRQRAQSTFCASLHLSRPSPQAAMSALGVACGRSLQLHTPSRKDQALRRPFAAPRQRRCSNVHCIGSEQGSAPEDLGGGNGGAAQQTPRSQGASSSDTPELQPPSTVKGPRAAGEGTSQAAQEGSQLGDNAGVREDAPGSAPELDGAAEAQATPTAQASGTRRRKVDT